MNDYILRIRHLPTDQTYIVDLTDDLVYFDYDEDGRIHGRDVLSEDPGDVSIKQLIAAAQAIRENYDIPWPRSQAAEYPDFESGWRLSKHEIRVLKQENSDKYKEN